VSAKAPRLLVTGFGPFPGVALNPSGFVAARVGASARLRRAPGGPPRAVVLRTAYAALDDALAPLLAEGPLAVLMIGVAGRARRVRVEVRAANRASRLMPDAGGAPARRLTLDPHGPAGRHAGTAARKAEAILRRAGLPVRVSRDAGRYLCNAAYYRALALPCPVLFLHIPKPPPVRPRRGAAPVARLRWHERLAEAFAEVATMLAVQARSAT
jgi:pyroglutamyl-peptidase